MTFFSLTSSSWALASLFYINLWSFPLFDQYLLRFAHAPQVNFFSLFSLAPINAIDRGESDKTCSLIFERCEKKI